MLFIYFLSILLIACNGSGSKADAYGNFETDEITVSSETGGRIIWLAVEEGQIIDSGKFVGLIDTTQIALRRKQVEAQIVAASSRIPNITAQANVQHEQIKVLNIERNRLTKLLAD